MFAERRLAFDPIHPIDEKLEADSVRLEERCAEELPDVRADGELLIQLPCQ